MSCDRRLVVIGHKDHGKSTLIGRLLWERGMVRPDRLAEVRCAGGEYNFAFLLDTFQEERDGGLTIDMVQVPLKGETQELLLIDCPGHHELIQNMLTGVSDADAALLVVSAAPHEGIAPQTIEHARLARLTGVRTVMVAVTKMDTVAYARERFAVLQADALSLLKDAGYHGDIPVVPVSSCDGVNLVAPARDRMPWYAGLPLLQTVEAGMPARSVPAAGQVRVMVQDVISVDGAPCVLGMVLAGQARPGVRVTFQPSGVRGVVRYAHGHAERAGAAGAGETIAFSVEGACGGAVRRGDICGADDHPPVPVTECAATVFLFGDRVLAPGAEIAVQCGTAVVPAVVTAIAGEGLFRDARITLRQPIVMTRHDEMRALGRFVMRAAGRPVGLGIVTDVC